MLDFKLNKDIKKLGKIQAKRVDTMNIPSIDFLEKEINYYKREITI